MKIQKGDKLPDGKVFILDSDPKEVSIKKITLKTLITVNIEEKRNLGLKSTVGGVEIKPFK